MGILPTSGFTIDPVNGILVDGSLDLRAVPDGASPLFTGSVASFVFTFGQVTGSGVRTVFRAESTADPESGLTIDETVNIGADFTISDSADLQNSCVWGFDFTGLDGSSGGVILEAGGNVLGAYIGFDSNGDFIARCGDGSAARGASNEMSWFVDDSGTIAGDGTLVVEFLQTTTNRWTINVWWNSVSVTPTSSFDNTTDQSNWTGSNPSSYLLAGGEQNVVVGEYLTTVPVYTTASQARGHYQTPANTSAIAYSEVRIDGSGNLIWDVNGTMTAGITIADLSASNRVSCTYNATGDIAVSVNGATQVTATGATVPGNVQTLWLGNDNGSEQLTGYIQDRIFARGVTMTQVELEAASEVARTFPCAPFSIGMALGDFNDDFNNDFLI